jgi:hypothetical protein
MNILAESLLCAGKCKQAGRMVHAHHSRLTEESLNLKDRYQSRNSAPYKFFKALMANSLINSLRALSWVICPKAVSV